MLGLPDEITVALFDLDGVLTTTAAVHQSAWKNVFDRYLAERGDGSAPFSERDYLDYVDGRPRLDGVRTFLASRDIVADDDTVTAIAEDKNTEFLGVLERDGVDAYPGSVRYLEAARDAGLRIAVVTSSRNGAQVLDVAGLSKYVEHRVDGNTIVEEKLNGKPAPDSFLRGAELMGVPPAHAAVFEDAISGVKAGAAGAFGHVVGVDRVGDGSSNSAQAESMRSAGASIVVADLADLLDK